MSVLSSDLARGSARPMAARIPFPLQPAPKQYRGRGAVDVGARYPPPSRTGGTLRLEFRARLERGEALIDTFDRQTRAGGELGGEPGRRGVQAPRRAVDIIRGADHEQVGPIALQLPIDGDPVRAARGAECGRERGRSAADGIAAGDADTAGSEVERQNQAREALRHDRR